MIVKEAENRMATMEKYNGTLASYRQTMESAMAQTRYSEEEAKALEQAKLIFTQTRQAEQEYLHHLPRPTLSRCPICNQPLQRKFDPYGLDGLWWRSDAVVEEEPACMHFCVLRGAVDFNGHPLKGGDFEAHIGPQVPYIIPRLMEWPEMVAVVSEIQMENGYKAYPIAYFGKRRPPPQDLTSGWARTNYLYTTQLQKVQWRIPNDPWDFDLRPWVTQGRLQYCIWENDNLVLKSSVEEFPFFDLSGERRPTVVKDNSVWHEPFPEGSIIRPMF